MSTFLKDLRPGSFRGLSIEFERGSFGGGRRLATHEYPQNDKTFHEDMGRKARQYDVTGFIHGVNWLTDSNKFIDALEEKGAASLVHPWLGTLRVRTATFSVSYESGEAGVVRFSMKFLEDKDQTNPSSSKVNKVFAEQSIVSAKSASIEDFSNEFSTAGMPDFVSESATAQAVEVYSAAGEVGPGFDLNDAQAFGSDLMDAVKVGSDLSGVSVPSNPVFETIARAQENKNLNAINTIARRSGLIGQAEAYINTDFVTVDDAQLAITDIQESFDTEVLSTNNFDVVKAFSSLRIDTIKAISENAVNAKELFTKTSNGSRPSLIEAYDLYEDASRSVEIVGRNGVEHPSFMSGDVELLSS